MALRSPLSTALLSSHDVLESTYNALKKLGNTKKSLSGSHVLKESGDYHRTDQDIYEFNGVINEIDGRNFVFTFGKSGRFHRIFGIDEAIISGEIDWNEMKEHGWTEYLEKYRIVPNSRIEILDEEQTMELIEPVLQWNTYSLVGSSDGKLIAGTWYNPFSGIQGKTVPTMFEARKENDIMYKKEVVPFLTEYVRESLYKDIINSDNNIDPKTRTGELFICPIKYTDEIVDSLYEII